MPVPVPNRARTTPRLRRQALTSSLVESLLDHLRETRFPYAIEAFAAWTIVLISLVFHASQYLWSAAPFRSKTSSQSWWKTIPLTTLQNINHERSLEDLHRWLEEQTGKKLWTDEEFVAMVKSSDHALGLASSSMAYHLKAPRKNEQIMSNFELIPLLQRTWPLLLELHDLHETEYPFEISLIVPAYREHGRRVRSTLTRALDLCRQSCWVQVVVVDAGECTDLTKESVHDQQWGEVQLVRMVGGGGRGPCLNQGALHASGRILTFLHSDTLLPVDWDLRIRSALPAQQKVPITHACAFRFGIDSPAECLGENSLPGGILAQKLLSHARSRVFRLPFGDQVLSFPSSVFRRLGGYPHQPLMEDYELMNLLRKRSAVLPEKMVILDGPPSLCSPRRWLMYSVPYVILLNTYIIHRYERGSSPQELFELYYKTKRKVSGTKNY